MQEILSRESIGSRIRSLRVQNNHSQETVSKFLGMSRGNYSQIELGNQFPTYDMLYKISIFYNKSYEWLLHGQHAVLPDKALPKPTLGSSASTVHLVKNSDFYHYLTSRSKKAYIDSLGTVDISRAEQEVTYLSGVYRAFEVPDSGMNGIFQQGDVVTARCASRISDIRLNEFYVLITHEEILVRRVAAYFADTKTLVCKTDNPGYPIVVIKADDLCELWQVWGIYSTKVGDIVEQMGRQLKKFEKSITVLKKNIENIKTEVIENESDSLPSVH
ncbi:helix-turn-helix domain-containing protein [Daejeonella sp. JGW-45]|uniref:XRE family transcriptional regulator n=1 Tax=Daejeonella sp. JGW-45 TaxID=3034148 RepID=UPI0023ED19FB|nr:helix-turn-helix domain-containing protein [Daejeonella sp. JGW-45]